METFINIYGVVIDKSNNPINGVLIKYDNITTLTNPKGEFNILIPPNSTLNTLIFSKTDYSEETKNILKNNGEIKENLGIVRLSSLNNIIQEEISTQLPLNSIETLELTSINTNFEQLQQKKLRDIIKTLKYTLIPIILKLFFSFGISKISEAINKKFSKSGTCPTPEKLKKIIDKRNKLAKQLNITFKVIDSTLKSLGILQGILIITETSLNIIAATPSPTPPSPSILAGKLDSEIKKYKAINSGLIVILFVLRELLLKIIELLESLDFQIQECVKENSNISPQLETLNIEIINQINLLNQQTNLTTLEKVNGFSFDIETEQTTNNLKRKRAVAKNSKGVILLRGNYSYSSSINILIDELVFFIKINNLKAD